MRPAEPFPLPLSPLRLAEILGLGQRLALSLVRLDSLRTAMESGEFVPAERLTAAEQERYSGFRFRKRQLEWLGGRWAAKHAASMLRTETGPGDWGVESDPYGRPFYRPTRSGNPGLELSISHSDGLAAALAVVGSPCGLDLQKTTDAVLRVREKFCHETEEELLRRFGKTAQAAESLTMLWAAKEAVRKARGGHPLTGFLTMRLGRLERITERAWLFTLGFSDAREVEQTVVTWWQEDFATALTVIN